MELLNSQEMNKNYDGGDMADWHFSIKLQEMWATNLQRYLERDRDRDNG